ncbi:MAG: glycosyltransferase [Treponema sp.]|jgi:glycosyltransferase involved in cell wall biosynthesis|nr:glycosyltransferase [Treponema sp.]
MFVVHVLEPFASGVTTAVISITQQLPKINHLIIHGSRMWVDEIKNVKEQFPSYVTFIDWPFAGREISLKNDPKALISLINILKEYKDAVIHLHSSKAGFLGRIACRYLGIKRVIYTPHGASFIRTDISERDRWFFRLLERIGAAFGGIVVGCGKSEAELYHNLGGNGLFVSNGVPVSPVKKNENADIITFVGIASVQKTPALFNKIAARVEGNFFWVGDGPLRTALQSPNVTVTDWVDKAAVDSYLNRTFIYLSTSAWEGLPFGVLEAMNVGCALLLRDVPGNRDLVVQGENGYLFTGEDEAVTLLKQMLTDRVKTCDMGYKSRDIVKRDYSVEKMGREYLEIYEKLSGKQEKQTNKAV